MISNNPQLIFHQTTRSSELPAHTFRIGQSGLCAILSYRLLLLHWLVCVMAQSSFSKKMPCLCMFGLPLQGILIESKEFRDNVEQFVL